MALVKARIALACCLVLFGSAASPFSDGFEANALEPSDIKAISIDAAPAVPVQNVKVDAAGLLTAVKVGPPVPPVPVCPPPTPGMTGFDVPWTQLSYGLEFPASQAWPMPVGSYTLRGRSVNTRGPSLAAAYVITSFVMEPNKNLNLAMYGAQPVPEAGRDRQFPGGYNPARPTKAMFVVVSPCRGDLRPQDRLSSDPWLSKCRATINEGPFGISTVKPAPAKGCPLEPGQTYYLHFAPNIPGTGTSTCKPGDNGRCEINLRVK